MPTLDSREFRDQVLDALQRDDAVRLAELVNAYEPLRNESPDIPENEVLVAIGKYGASGRTSRYKPYVNILLEKRLQPDLTSCAFLGLFEQAKTLVSRDASVVSSADGSGSPPLHAAAERGDLAMVVWLCEVGADPCQPAADGELPIVRAFHAGPWKPARASDVVEFLAPLCGLDQHLWCAAGRGDVDRVKAILSENFKNVDEPDEAGVSPLFHACHNNQREVVEILLNAGADPNRVTPMGDSPLATACLHRLSQECDIAIIEALVKAGAIQSIESAVITADSAFVRGYYQRNPEKLDDIGTMSPIHYAVHAGVADSLELLIELGVIPDADLWDHIERIFGSDIELIQRLRSLNRPN